MKRKKNKFTFDLSKSNTSEAKLLYATKRSNAYQRITVR